MEEIKSREFSADVVWLLHTDMLCRFTMASCYKTIYHKLKKVTAWNITVWNTLVKGYQSFVVVWNCSNKFVFIDRRSSDRDCPESQGCDKDGIWLARIISEACHLQSLRKFAEISRKVYISSLKIKYFFKKLSFLKNWYS